MRKPPGSTNAALWFVLGAALGLVIGMIVGFVTPALGQRTTEATLNVRVEDTTEEIAADVGSAMDRASVVRLQEVWDPHAVAGIEQALSEHPGWRVTSRVYDTGDPILWDSTVWEPEHLARSLLAHRGVAHLTPDRFLTWKALRLRGSSWHVLIANVHAVSGYCSGRPQQALRQHLARDYWSTVLAWTRRKAAAHPERVILLGGDFNCWLSRRAQAWLPGAALRPLYRLDRAPWYDHLLTLRTPGAPRAVRRWEVPAHSDHDLNLRRLVF